MKMYRYEDNLYTSVSGVTCVDIHLLEFNVIKTTPRGVWITMGDNSNWKEYIGLFSRRKYAYESEKDALNSYVNRKESQVRKFTNQLTYAKEALDKGNKMLQDGGYR